MTQEQKLMHRISMIEDDAKGLVKFISEHNLSDKLLDDGAGYINNILIACDMSDDESLNWKPYKLNSMEKLNKIIEDMALQKFRSDVGDRDKRNTFIFKHATIGEFIQFFTTKKSSVDGKSWVASYGHIVLGEMSGLAESFCYEVLWKRLRDKYIEVAVKSLEDKVDKSFKVTIESL